MAETDLIITRGTQSVAELLHTVEAAIDNSSYKFLGVAFRQRFAWADSDERKLALIKEYVTLVD
ncbi:hypothetical protein [Lacticaseibacillus daqingensis]|uniref:hypothetical protein n=1 Tax=Lacticaseibacillus daqingensis TaxID=2486014 RepID=UPI000F78DAD9|nr:hypothetical protein [Lacticaseibacillus daqingensis]